MRWITSTLGQSVGASNKMDHFNTNLDKVMGHQMRWITSTLGQSIGASNEMDHFNTWSKYLLTLMTSSVCDRGFNAFCISCMIKKTKCLFRYKLQWYPIISYTLIFFILRYYGTPSCQSPSYFLYRYQNCHHSCTQSINTGTYNYKLQFLLDLCPS